MFTFLGLALIIVPSLIHIALTKRPRSAENILEIVLLYWLVLFIGLGSLLASYGHAFMSDQIARSIGWQPGSPFQLEIAATNLAFGVLGVLCFWFRGNFWLATGIGQSVFVFGAAWVHVSDAIARGNFAINNIGPVLILNDILLPVLLLLLLFRHKKIKGY